MWTLTVAPVSWAPHRANTGCAWQEHYPCPPSIPRQLTRQKRMAQGFAKTRVAQLELYLYATIIAPQRAPETLLGHGRAAHLAAQPSR